MRIKTPLVAVASVIFLLVFGEHGFSVSVKSKKFPYGLITPGYGIVTEDDLAYDAFWKTIDPYDPNESLGSLHWQCLPLKNVTAKFDSWRGPDGMGPWNKIYTMCTLEIDVRDENGLQIYTDRRGHQVEFCQDFIREWKHLTENQEMVCLNGDGGTYYTDEIDGKHRLWTWEKFKTKRGCYSYFAYRCDTHGCSSGHCKH